MVKAENSVSCAGATEKYGSGIPEGEEMTKIRPTVQHSEWKLSKHEFYTAYHFALQYNEWKEQYNALKGLSAVTGDGMPQGSAVGNPTERKGIKMAEISKSMALIENTVREADSEMYEWLLEGVTKEAVSFNYLHMRYKMPFDKRRYYESRRKFYYLLFKKINF